MMKHCGTQKHKGGMPVCLSANAFYGANIAQRFNVFIVAIFDFFLHQN
jgi:hypothetical protein